MSEISEVKAVTEAGPQPLPFAEQKPRTQPEIWAIGGGKGGTGKSFVTSSLAMSLASQGRRVIVMDADLGGANLHSFMGIKRPDCCIADFFERKVPLKDLVVEAGSPNLGFIMGDVQSPESEGIKHTQKLKLYRHVRELEADYVLIDLGAGVHVNTIDTFLLADRMIVIAVPAVTAIENLYQFIRAVFFRKIKSALASRGMRDIAIEAWRNRERHGITNLRDLSDHLRKASPMLEELFANEMDSYRLHLVLNQVRTHEDIALGASVRSIVRKCLGFHAEYSGYVHFDETVLRCLNRATPFIRTRPGTVPAREVERLGWNIRDGNQVRDIMMTS